MRKVDVSVFPEQPCVFVGVDRAGRARVYRWMPKQTSGDPVLDDALATYLGSCYPMDGSVSSVFIFSDDAYFFNVLIIDLKI